MESKRKKNKKISVFAELNNTSNWKNELFVVESPSKKKCSNLGINLNKNMNDDPVIPNNEISLSTMIKIF
jgi:hypothetical protein